MIRPARTRALLLTLALALAGPALAAERRPVEADVASVARFIDAAGPVCQRRPAASCIDAGWRFADADGDDRLDAGELRRRYRDFVAWFGAAEASLDANSQAMLALGLWMTSIVGIDDLVASYDADRDGRLTRAEALADVTLDDRPLGRLLLDPKSVDRAAFTKRLGTAGPFLMGLFGAAEAGD